MEALALVIVITGIAMILCGNIWFLVVAFKEHILWGLGCLLFPITSLFFLIIYWKESVKPFGVSVMGFVLIFLMQFAMK